MFDLLKAQPARRAAYSALEPFVRKTNLSGSERQPGDWLQPHILGFLATLVTLVAERKCGVLRTHALASVQSSVLSALTGIGPELVGEEICLLSSRRDADFTAGAMGAIAFLEAMDEPSASVGDGAADALDSGIERAAPGRPVLDELWAEHVERHVGANQPLS